MTTNPVLGETLLTFSEAAHRAPQIGSKPRSVKLVYVWADRGVKVNGHQIRLESARVGGRRVTSVEAIERFLEATSATPNTPQPIRTPRARQKASEAAVAYLKKEFASVSRRRTG